MKKFTILTIAPALTLLIAGCSGTNSMQSTEYDDMYYSTADKTEYMQPIIEQAYQQAEEAEQQDEAASAEPVEILNPEYADDTKDITSNYYGNDEYEYYDGREYDPRNNWYRPNYSFVDPSWAYAPYPSYADYSYHDRYYRHRYADPFYNPFYYDPFAYRPYWGSGVTIAISFNYGWGNYYNRYYPYYGYGYTPWYGYCDNYYGYNYVYDYPRYATPYKVQYGPRGERGGVVTQNTPRDGRSERGSLTETEGSEQRAVQQGRPSRTERGRATERIGTPASEESKEIITNPYRSRSGSEARPTRERIDRPREEQQQREVPATRTRSATETRSTGEYTPRRETRSTETRQSTPARDTNRSYEQRETRRSEPAPSRSSSSGSSSGSSGSERGGRPPRGN